MKGGGSREPLPFLRKRRAKHRFLSVDPLFYLSSFQSLVKSPSPKATGFSMPDSAGDRLLTNTYFSCVGKKSTKRSRVKGRYVQMRPLYNPPPHRHPAFKNVPIFERLHSANLKDCTAEPAENRDIFSGRWSKAARQERACYTLSVKNQRFLTALPEGEPRAAAPQTPNWQRKAGHR